jgi:hypothetical protein
LVRAECSIFVEVLEKSGNRKRTPDALQKMVNLGSILPFAALPTDDGNADF